MDFTTGTTDDGIELLLVEDNHDEARLVERMLHRTRVEELERTADWVGIDTIDHVDTLADALDTLQDGSPDVVLLDLGLPDSDGLETVETVIAHAPETPIVVLTGYDDTTLGLEAIQRGAQDFLVKGTIDSELIRRTLRYAIERERHQRTLAERNHELALLTRIIGQDIRNDMNMVVGWLDVLRDRVEPTDEALIDSALDASRGIVELADTAAEAIDALDTDEVARTTYPLGSILDSEIERIQQHENVAVTVQPYDESEPIVVSATPMLASVFRQLLSNAVRHNVQSEPTITIEVEPDDDEVVVHIADDGVSLSEDTKAALTGDDHEVAGPTGIRTGLYLVTMLVEQFDGRFEVRDNEPRGTIMTVALDRITFPSE